MRILPGIKEYVCGQFSKRRPCMLCFGWNKTAAQSRPYCAQSLGSFTHFYPIPLLFSLTQANGNGRGVLGAHEESQDGRSLWRKAFLCTAVNKHGQKQDRLKPCQIPAPPGCEHWAVQPQPLLHWTKHGRMPGNSNQSEKHHLEHGLSLALPPCSCSIPVPRATTALSGLPGEGWSAQGCIVPLFLSQAPGGRAGSE